MYRIGKFSKLGRVNIKTLHHYDEVGLLVPAHVDEENGYRDDFVLGFEVVINRSGIDADLGSDITQRRAGVTGLAHQADADIERETRANYTVLTRQEKRSRYRKNKAVAYIAGLFAATISVSIA